VPPWGGPNSCKIPDDVEIPDCDGLTCTIPKEATEVRAEKAVKVPSKEACERAARWLIDDARELHGIAWRRAQEGDRVDVCEIDDAAEDARDVAAYLRSLHGPCPTCGMVGGGGRVNCPDASGWGACNQDPDDGIPKCPPGTDDDCTVPCPECGDESNDNRCEDSKEK